MLLIGIGGLEIMQGQMETGDLLAFYQYLGAFIGPIMAIGFVSNMMSRVAISADRISEVIDSEIDFKEGSLDFKKFEELSVKNLDLKLPEGEDGSSLKAFLKILILT